MAGLETLNLLVEQARRERDEAALRLREAEAALEQAQRQAGQLQAYRAEYTAHWSGRFRQAGAIELLRCYQSFMARLEQALGQQQAVLEHAGQRVQQAREQLLERELRMASVGKLIERREDERRRADARRDQRQTDEAAQRARRPAYGLPPPTTD